MTHKTLYLSSAQDPSSWGKRLTQCRLEIDSIEVLTRWENVTCEKCWGMKAIVPVKKKRKNESGYKFAINDNGFADKSRRVWG